jgi:CRP-like cAMP-binding protein
MNAVKHDEWNSCFSKKRQFYFIIYFAVEESRSLKDDVGLARGTLPPITASALIERCRTPGLGSARSFGIGRVCSPTDGDKGAEGTCSVHRNHAQACVAAPVRFHHPRDELRNEQNHIIAILPSGDRARFLRQCTLVELATGEIASPHRSDQVYFPVDALISILSAGEATPRFQVGLVGSEGMYGIPCVLGLRNTRVHASVLSPGRAWNISAMDFQKELSDNKSLQPVLNRYINVVIQQLYSTCRCIRFHTIRQRLAKWLLMSHDRTDAAELRITQQTLASLLGVRRVGITAAATQLRRNGAIEYSRGHVTILSRKKLEKEACACYADETTLYAHAL